MPKVAVGMSGGVDSAVAAYLLKIAGYEVIGVTLKTWIAEDGEKNRCCEIDDAQKAAWKLGIPYYVVNSMSDFRCRVTEPFIDRYICGMTPNPCTECNYHVKWKKMLETADSLGADYIATGHYANIVRLDNGRYTVSEALHPEKDQTYMLYKLSQEQLSRTLMPLGRLSKAEVRHIAEEIGLELASKPDSQEICFVPDGDYAGYIADNAGRELPPEGDFVDASGKVLGRHKGIISYTVGQRRGLGLPLGYPAYVTRILPETDEVVVGPEEELLRKEIFCGEVNYMGLEPLEEGETACCRVKIRYHHSGSNAKITPCGDGTVRVVFDEAVRAAAPGQAAVFYDGNGCVAGGGIILP